MIRSYRDKRIPDVRAGTPVRGLSVDIIARAQRRIAQLDAAVVLQDLAVPPSNHLEALKGDRKHSIRINRQWRLCFVWREGDAWDVEIVDYH